MIDERDHLVDAILGLADSLFRTLLPTVPRDLLTLDVTMPQIKILLILYVGGPRRMSDIAADLDVTLPAATSLIDGWSRSTTSSGRRTRTTGG